MFSSFHRYVCLEGSSVPNPNDNITGYICPEGFYCEAGTPAPQPCPLGTFQASQGQDNCTTCPAGYMCDQLNMTVPNVCKTGKTITKNFYNHLKQTPFCVTRYSLLKQTLCVSLLKHTICCVDTLLCYSVTICKSIHLPM